MRDTMKKKKKILPISIIFTLIVAIVIGSASIAGASTLLSDIEGHWAQSTIEDMVGKGIIGGYPDGTFKPDNNITRAEFASLLVRAFALEPGPGKVFDDTADHWARDAIGTASYHGLVSGYSDTLFGPDDPVTREQMAVMIVKATKVEPAESGKAFTDSAQIAAWAEEAVAKASAAELIAGYPDGTFRPKANATRAEAAVILARSMKLVEQVIPPPPPEAGVDEEEEDESDESYGGGGTGGGGGGGGGPGGPGKTPVSAISVTGVSVVGATLEAGDLKPTNATVKYQWQRAAAKDGGYVDIEGATGKTYKLVADDAGKWIKVKATGTGNYTGTVESKPVGPVLAASLSWARIDDAEITPDAIGFSDQKLTIDDAVVNSPIYIAIKAENEADEALAARNVIIGEDVNTDSFGVEVVKGYVYSNGSWEKVEDPPKIEYDDSNQYFYYNLNNFEGTIVQVIKLTPKAVNTFTIKVYMVSM